MFLAALGCSWLLLAETGLLLGALDWPSGLLLAPPGCSLLLPAAPACSWLLLSDPGCSWLLLATPWPVPAAPVWSWLLLAGLWVLLAGLAKMMVPDAFIRGGLLRFAVENIRIESSHGSIHGRLLST